DRLLNADIADVPTIITDMEPYRHWVNPLLEDALAEAQVEQDARKQLHLSLALPPDDSSRFDYLYERLLDAAPAELRVIPDRLRIGQDSVLNERLEQVLADAQAKPERRLRAACALAGCQGEGEEAAGCWPVAAKVVVQQLLTAVQKNPSHYPLLLEL